MMNGFCISTKKTNQFKDERNIQSLPEKGQVRVSKLQCYVIAKENGSKVSKTLG
jgi:hypothetical protein